MGLNPAGTGCCLLQFGLFRVCRKRPSKHSAQSTEIRFSHVRCHHADGHLLGEHVRYLLENGRSSLKLLRDGVSGRGSVRIWVPSPWRDGADLATATPTVVDFLKPGAIRADFGRRPFLERIDHFQGDTDRNVAIIDHSHTAVDQIWPGIGQLLAELRGIRQVWPRSYHGSDDLERGFAEVDQVRPTLAPHRPNLGQVQPKFGRNRPNGARSGA